jgi:hypothetical protein
MLNYRYYFVKIATFILLVLLCGGIAFAENAREMLDRLISINDTFNVQRNTLLAGQTLQIINNDNTIKSETRSFTFFSQQGELTLIKERTGNAYFLSTARGYWLYNKKLRTPLKISGNYKIVDIEIQDIFRIDYANDYKVLAFDDINETVFMERANRKMIYPYVLISKQYREGNSDSLFEVCFMDRAQKPLRKLRFIPGLVDGYYCFNIIEVYNMVFEKTESARYITQSIKSVSAPAALFNESNMTQFISYIDSMIE